MVYNADIFGSERMAAMLEQFQRLLEQMVITPEAPVCNYLMPAKLRTQRSALRRSKNELADVEEVICNHPSIKQTKVVEVDSRTRRGTTGRLCCAFGRGRNHQQ
jgi:hypothetical protein